MRTSVRQITADVINAVPTLLAVSHATVTRAFNWHLTGERAQVSIGSRCILRLSQRHWTINEMRLTTRLLCSLWCQQLHKPVRLRTEERDRERERSSQCGERKVPTGLSCAASCSSRDRSRDSQLCKWYACDSNERSDVLRMSDSYICLGLTILHSWWINVLVRTVNSRI